jgi:hypothetical protein
MAMIRHATSRDDAALARRVLEEVYATFDEGHALPDLQAARNLLNVAPQSARERGAVSVGVIPLESQRSRYIARSITMAEGGSPLADHAREVVRRQGLTLAGPERSPWLAPVTSATLPVRLVFMIFLR